MREIPTRNNSIFGHFSRSNSVAHLARKLLNVFAKNSISDVQLGSKYVPRFSLFFLLNSLENAREGTFNY